MSTSCKNEQKIFLRRQHSSHRISQSNIPLFFMRGHRPHCSKHIWRHTVQGELRKTGSMSQRIGSFNDTFFCCKASQGANYLVGSFPLWKLHNAWEHINGKFLVLVQYNFTALVRRIFNDCKISHTILTLSTERFDMQYWLHRLDEVRQYVYSESLFLSVARFHWSIAKNI